MERGDGNIRLFLFRLEKTGLTVYRMHQVNKNVYIIETNCGKKALKGFDSNSKLLFQYEFLQKLLERDKRFMYYFERFPNGARCMKWNRRYWVLIPYLFGKKVNFSHIHDQVDVFQALHDFHRRSLGIHMDVFFVRRLLPYYEQRFRNFSRLIYRFPQVQMKMFDDYKEWGLYALTKLAEEKCLEMMEHAAEVKRMWTHGDVAHHNFLRVTKQRVILIAFDQLAIGPKEYDELQLSQRILCSNGWKFGELLQTVKTVQQLANQRWYLYSLIFPNDIYREWTYFFQGKTNISIERLLAYTNQQYFARLPLIKELICMLN